MPPWKTNILYKKTPAYCKNYEKALIYYKNHEKALVHCKNKQIYNQKKLQHYCS